MASVGARSGPEAGIACREVAGRAKSVHHAGVEVDLVDSRLEVVDPIRVGRPGRYVEDEHVGIPVGFPEGETARQSVIAGSTIEGVVAEGAPQVVVAPAAAQYVVPHEAAHELVVLITEQAVGSRTADQRVVTVTAELAYAGTTGPHEVAEAGAVHAANVLKGHATDCGSDAARCKVDRYSAVRVEGEHSAVRATIDGDMLAVGDRCREPIASRTADQRVIAAVAGHERRTATRAAAFVDDEVIE